MAGTPSQQMILSTYLDSAFFTPFPFLATAIAPLNRRQIGDSSGDTHHQHEGQRCENGKGSNF